MASIRERRRKDGAPYWSVLYRHAGRQRSPSFPDQAAARRFAHLVAALGSSARPSPRRDTTDHR